MGISLSFKVEIKEGTSEAEEGLELELTVGFEVIWMVGCSEDKAKGLELGFIDASTNGLFEGSAVGCLIYEWIMGRTEGIVDGQLLGPSVGLRTGRAVGVSGNAIEGLKLEIAAGLASE